jgi:hypothetical protein
MIPRPIYELLPYLYLAFGALAAAGLDMTEGKVSGILLCFAGFLIFKMRSDYRRRFWDDNQK